MAKKRSQPTKAKTQMVAGLDRWEGEGGAQIPAWTLRYRSGDLGDTERRVLECLGAAVVSEWNELPTDVRRAIFQHASAGKTYNAARLRAQIARFLHNHKDDSDAP